MNQTPLMAAAAAGNVALARALLERGADRDAVDHYGCNALHIALRECYRDPEFARGPGAVLYELLAPAHIDVKSGERLVRIDKQLSEYFLFQTFWTLFKSRFTSPERSFNGGIDSTAILNAWEGLPESLLRAARNKRQHVTHVLSRNEVKRDYAYNRALFKRMSHGWYQFNPLLEVRVHTAAGEQWRPVFALLNLPLVGEFASRYCRRYVSDYLKQTGLPDCAPPVMAEREVAAEAQEKRRQEEQARLLEAQRIDWAPPRQTSDKPRWGTHEARMEAMLELQRRIDQSREPKEGEG